MTDELRHEAMVSAAVLGIVKAHGWMAMPITVDVNKAVADLRAAGGPLMERAHAIEFTRGLIDKICEHEGWSQSSFSEVDERGMVTLFGQAYDELVAAVESEETIA